MNLFWRVDDWMVSKVEKFCHKVQRQFGTTNYGLLGICSLGMAGLMFAMATGEALNGDIPKNLIITRFFRYSLPLTTFFIVLELAGAFWLWRVGEEQANGRISRGLANPEKISFPSKLTRIFAAFSFPSFCMYFGLSFDLLFYISMSIWVFLKACDPLPPCRGTFWENINAYFAKPARQKNNSAE